MGLRKISPRIRTKLKRIHARYIEVGCARPIPKTAIRRGEFRHLGLRVSKGTVVHVESTIPEPSVGRYSDRNVHGFEIVRKDLPKETRYNVVEAPNWGDTWRGTHPVFLPYERYPRDVVAPRLSQIRVHHLGTSPDGRSLTYGFTCTDRLDTKDPGFEAQLLEVMNFIQENVGCHDVAPYGAKATEYLKELRISWEILPPGTIEQVATRVFQGRPATREEKDVFEDRYDFFVKLRAERFIFGTSGLQRYFGAQIRDDLVVFENIRYGNAVYVMFENWREMSKKTRVQLMSGRFGVDFVRIVHAPGWKQKVIAATENPR